MLQSIEMNNLSDLKIALIHDYLKEYGGAERVLESLHQIFPEAPIYTAYFDIEGFGPHKERIKKWDIHTSWLQKVPFAGKLISPFRIFAPMIFESFDLKNYDVVMSSCNIYFAKAVITKPETLHISYIHTPPRYLYGYATSFNYKKNPIIRIFAELANHILRVYDFETSQRPDVLVANSKVVKERIKKFYRRDSEVIYPPVDVEEFRVMSQESRKKEDYYLSLSRLWEGKGVDLVIKACTELRVPLKVVGTGPEEDRLKNLAGPIVEFLGQVSDDERVKLMSQAKALIVAAEEEDFGITAVESQAAGTPVIALKQGGYLETVVDGKTGVFFKDPSVESLKEVLEKFDPSKYKTSDLINNAEKFSQKRFEEEIKDLVSQNYPKTN